MNSLICTASFFVALLPTVVATAALAVTISIDDKNGAIYDGILDGFPGLASFDGEPDLGNNALGVAFKVLVTEERAIAEFPLDQVLAVAPQATDATLHFNIDDVLSTFGPGTDFAGRACRRLFVHLYSGNGLVELSDFKNISGDGQLVDTTPHGNISDTTLLGSGPLQFGIAITTNLNLLLLGGASHLGVVWRCTDSPTGTSLDNLGDASVGPPGIGGARLPFLIIDVEGTAATPAPTTTPTATATPSATPAAPTATRSPSTTVTMTATATPSSTPTPSHSALPTSTSTATPSPTASTAIPLPATATPTEPSLVTPSPTIATSICVGDCDGSASVTATDLMVELDAALNDFVSVCDAGDANGDQRITVEEIVAAVTNNGSGCAQRLDDHNLGRP